MLAVWSRVIQDIRMSEGYPVDPDEVRGLYKKISPITESEIGAEAQTVVHDWNELFYNDMCSEAEVLMLMYGHSVSDRYLYGVCSAVIALKEENGGHLPVLTDGQYELDKEVQDSHQAAQDAACAEYFTKLEETFETSFPLTATLLSALGHDLKTRLHAPDIEIEEGFIPGWYKAIKVVVPLFMDDEQ